MESDVLDIAAVAHQEIDATAEFSGLANKGQQFVAWYLHRAHGIDALAAVDAVTDGPDDKQIDAVFIDDEEARVLIIQGKFYEAGSVTGEAVGECLRAIAGLKNLPELQKAANAKLAAKVGDIQGAIDSDYSVTVELVTVGAIVPNAKRDIYSFQQGISGNGLSIEIVPVDGKALVDRYCQATQLALPKINHRFDIAGAQWSEPKVNDTRCLLVVMPLEETIGVPGIDNGMLFRKNVRQALGKGTKVNRGMRNTLQSEEIRDFFFYHNGITAICDSFELDTERRELSVTGLNVVNGCQSLTTLLQNSEAIRQHGTGHVLWRFYEIQGHDRADKISTFTNSQNAVSSRDLASNDAVQLLLKQRIEGRYRDVCFATKRGDVAPPGKKLLDSAVFAKLSVSWDHWMPYRAHSEQTLFDRYYRKIFHPQLEPDDVVPLFDTYEYLKSVWGGDAIEIREELRRKAYHTPYHVFTAMGLLIAAANPDAKGRPLGRVLALPALLNHRDRMLQLACKVVQRAFEKANKAAGERNEILAIENWLKSKDAVDGAMEIANMTYDVLDPDDDLLTALRVPADMFRLPTADDE